MTDTVYRESQKMDDMILYILLAALAVINLILYRMVQTTDEMYFQLSLATMIIFIFIFKLFRLDTLYTNKGLYYRFFPFHRNEKLISWDQIESAKLVTIRPLRDYGGYGIRYNFKSKAYIMKGCDAVQISWNDGRKPLIIGIQNPEEIHMLLAQWLPKSKYITKS
jgi:hypothetical protein